MPICKNCGKVLADDEICNCSNITTKKNKKDKASSLTTKIAITTMVVILVAFGVFSVWFSHGLLFSQYIKSENSSSSSVCKAVNSSIREMSENGYKTNGYYLICSDRSKNINIPDYLDENKLYNSISNFYSDISKKEWFAVVEKDNVTYSASANSWKSKPVGSYPASDFSGIFYYDTGFIKTEKRNKATLKMLYADTEKKVKGKANDNDFIKALMKDDDQHRSDK